MANSKNLVSNGVAITGIGHYLPERIVTNDEIRPRLKYPEMHPAEKAVIGNIGVTERRRANEKETAQFMAAETSKMILKDAGKNRRMWTYSFWPTGRIAFICRIWLLRLPNLQELPTH